MFCREWRCIYDTTLTAIGDTSPASEGPCISTDKSYEFRRPLVYTTTAVLHLIRAMSEVSPIEKSTSTNEPRIFYCCVWNLKELQTSPKKLSARVKKFLSIKKDRLTGIVPKFIVVDRMERCVRPHFLSLTYVTDFWWFPPYVRIG